LTRRKDIWSHTVVESSKIMSGAAS